MKNISTTKAPRAIGPYSQGILTKNDLLFVSGQLPIDPETNEIVQGDIILQTHRILRNIGAILHEANMSYDNIVKSTIYLIDINVFDKINQVYSSYFKNNYYPARECMQVSGLPKNAQIEISVIAT